MDVSLKVAEALNALRSAIVGGQLTAAHDESVEGALAALQDAGSGGANTPPADASLADQVSELRARMSVLEALTRAPLVTPDELSAAIDKVRADFATDIEGIEGILAAQGKEPPPPPVRDPEAAPPNPGGDTGGAGPDTTGTEASAAAGATGSAGAAETPQADPNPGTSDTSAAT